MRFASSPLIAKLILTSRITTHTRMKQGRYGRIIEHDEVLYVDLAAVERAEGVQFSADQIAQAAAGKPARVLTIPDEKEAV
jgi:hypothetical protein